MALVARLDNTTALGAARIVNVIALVLTFAATATIVFTLAGPNPILLVVSELLVVFGLVQATSQIHWNVIGLTGLVLSEPLFIPFALAALLLCAYTGNGRRVPTGPLVVCVILATLTRYVGVAIGVAVGLAILLTSRRQCRRALIVVASAPLGLVAWQLVDAWFWHARAPRALAWHPGAVDLKNIVDVVSSWFSLDSTPLAVRWVFVLIVVLAPLVVVAVPAFQKIVFDRNLGGEPKDRLLRALVLGTPAFLAVVVVSQMLFDATIPSDQRILAPTQPVLYLALVALCALSWQGRRAEHHTSVAAYAALTALIALALAITIPSISHVHSDNIHMKQTARQQEARRLTSRYRALPPDTILFTNQPSGVWLESGHVAYMIPLPIIATTNQRNPDYVQDVEEVGRILRDGHGLVAIETGVVPLQASPTRFAKLADLHVGAVCDDGTELLVSTGAAPALPRC